MADYFATMPADDYWGTLLFLLVATIGGLIATFLFFQRARIIEDTPTSKIKSAAQGYVEIEGIVRRLPGIELLAKLTQTPCVWFSYEIERYIGGKNESWVTEEKYESKYHFIIEDDTGKCLVNPVGAAITPQYKFIWYGSSFYPAADSAPRESTGLFHVSVGMSGRYRYTEKRIHDSDKLYALGNFKTYNHIDQIPSLNNALSEEIRRLKADRIKLHTQYDRNNDGKIDIEEWQHARNEVLKSLRENYIDNSDRALHVLDKPKERRHPFLLSAYEQDELAGKYKLYSWIALAVFFSAGSVTTLMITARLS